MQHPYRSQPSKAFWNRTVNGRHPMEVADWYEKRFSLDGCKIATAGSCFAQHIGRHLRQSGFNYLDAEPAPDMLPEEKHLDFGYSMYSARYGNVYTSRQLLQLAQRALGQFTPDETFWEKDGGVVDPFRPTIEPVPFGTVAELESLRAAHLDAVAGLLEDADVFVFTLGLTEVWLDSRDGAAFPLCPGTAGGTFDGARHKFHNLGFPEVYSDMEAFVALMRTINPRLRFLLTVSPVPLMATATENQVAVASSYSKSVLRAVAGELVQAHNFIDYFPSYEIVTSPFMQGSFFQPNARDVTANGVEHVMRVFFSQHTRKAEEAAPQQVIPGLEVERLAAEAEAERVKCDEELLDAFKGSEK